MTREEKLSVMKSSTIVYSSHMVSISATNTKLLFKNWSWGLGCSSMIQHLVQSILQNKVYLRVQATNNSKLIISPFSATSKAALGGQGKVPHISGSSVHLLTSLCNPSRGCEISFSTVAWIRTMCTLEPSSKCRIFAPPEMYYRRN